jgi:FixJ family two-component response regulator
MPRISCEDAFQEMRNVHEEVPVVFASGYGQQEVNQRFADKGLAGFVQKPYTMGRLQEVLTTFTTPIK